MISYSLQQLVVAGFVGVFCAALNACSDPNVPKHEVGETFQDCEYCPEMTVIPSGTFLMGAPGKDADAKARFEQPQRRVTFDTPFAVGTTEITVGQYTFCQLEGGCGAGETQLVLPLPGGTVLNSKDRPELYDAMLTSTWPRTSVSWSEAKAYTDWLTEKTGRSYRLLTEAEWEYSAKAGTDTIYWWGDELLTGKAHCYKCYDYKLPREKKRPMKVASFAPNPFGLYDFNGNAEEWVFDCRAIKLRDKRQFLFKDLKTQDCESRAIRGGTYANGWLPRPTQRAFSSIAQKWESYGFRIQASDISKRNPGKSEIRAKSEDSI